MAPLKTKVFLLFVGILGIMSIPAFSFALSTLQDSDINISMIPENPQPYQDVTIQINSYATDLNKAMIEWRSGSRVVISGYGKTSYSFKALGPNTTTVFDITITPQGETDQIVKKIAVSPSEVQILWEAVDSYTPPFYKGKAFVSSEGTIKAVAIPNTSNIKSTKGNIVYTWKADDKTVQGASGYNKDSFVFANNVLNTSEKLSVAASSIDGNYSAVGNTEIPIVSPKLIFYKKSPTKGVLYNQALVDETTLDEDEMTIVAEPYFLALKGNESDFNYSWKINSDDIDTPSKKTELTVHPTDRGGYASISLLIENVNMLFQKVSGSLKLNL